MSEPVIFMRKQNGSDEDWDDSKIVAAYDKAMSALKKKITRKIQRELGLNDEDVEEFISDTASSNSKSKKGGGKKKKKKNKKRKWAVGSSCRAMFSEDGEEYEAVIINIDGHWGVVRFIGYGNEEEVLLDDLIPSQGKEAIQGQIEAANNLPEESEIDEVKHHDGIPTADIKDEISSADILREINGFTNTFEPMKRIPMSFPIPPLPPPLFGSHPRSSEFQNQMRKQDDINSMLMSWFMCGYQTGWYERGQQLQKN